MSTENDKKRAEILALLVKGKAKGGIDPAEAAAMLADLERTAVASAAFSGGALRWKVAPKGGLSLYGVNSRMPVTLYVEQWERVFSAENTAAFHAYVKQWDGKDYTGERSVDGKKVAYTARIARKAA